MERPHPSINFPQRKNYCRSSKLFYTEPILTQRVIMNFRSRLLFIQVAFGLMFLTFGVGKIVEPGVWIAMVPAWFKQGLPLGIDTIMFYAAWIEIVLGVWIVLPIKPHIAALIAFLYYIPWAVIGGVSYAGVKDIAIAIILLGLTLISWPREYKLSYDE